MPGFYPNRSTYVDSTGVYRRSSGLSGLGFSTSTHDTTYDTYADPAGDKWTRIMDFTQPLVGALAQRISGLKTPIGATGGSYPIGNPNAVTVAAPGAFGSINTTWILLGAVGIGAFMLMRNKR